MAFICLESISSYGFYLIKNSDKTPGMIVKNVKITIGRGSVNSATGPDKTAENLAKILQIPKAVPHRATGNN